MMNRDTHTYRSVVTGFRLVMRQEKFTLNALSVSLVNQGGVAVTVNKNLVLEPGDQAILPYAQGTINRTVLEIVPNAPGAMEVIVLSTELSE